MLKNIKSKYILEIYVLSYLDDKRKLNLVKYSKKFQRKIEVNLVDYKCCSKKYIIYDTNKKVKEYNALNDKLIFEGEYLNKKRNGFGKEYYKDDNAIYIGEFLNGKKWNGKINSCEDIQNLKAGKGFIKEYYDDGRIKFEGQYLNGERNGEGKKFYKNGNVKFVGVYLNNKKYDGIGFDLDKNEIYKLKNGKGIVKKYNKNNELIFEGEYLNGEKNGKGKEYFNGKLAFEGEYLYNCKKHGKEFIDDYLEYEGDYLYNKKWNGKGYDKNNNIIYKLTNGSGNIKEYKNNELIFEGEYLNRKKNGNGKEYFRGKLIFEGEYLNDKRNGKGKEYYNNCLIYEGEYSNGIRNGKGIENIYDLKLHSPLLLLNKGKYRNIMLDKFQITDIKYNINSHFIFAGEYINGRKWIGIGREYDLDGNLKFEGQYLNGRKWNGYECKCEEEQRVIILYDIIKGEKTGKEKRQIFDYDYDLEFEGEYSNDMKNGEGFEYFKCGTIKIEANYINNVINGKVKEYYYTGRLKFEGEYLKGERNGKGEEFNYFGELIFKGEYLKGKRWNGKGKEYSSDDNLRILLFEGEYVNGVKKKNKKCDLW